MSLEQYEEAQKILLTKIEYMIGPGPSSTVIDVTAPNNIDDDDENKWRGGGGAVAAAAA